MFIFQDCFYEHIIKLHSVFLTSLGILSIMMRSCHVFATNSILTLIKTSVTLEESCVNNRNNLRLLLVKLVVIIIILTILMMYTFTIMGE